MQFINQAYQDSLQLTQVDQIKSYVIHITKNKTLTNKINEAYLFLHGFPANLGTKNQDIAESLTFATGINSFVLHYQGLGNSGGKFSFTESVKESIQAAHDLISKYEIKYLHIVGHSWGGLVGINVFKSIQSQRGKLILLAPFTVFPTDDSINNWLDSVEVEFPNLFISSESGFAKKNFYETKISYDPLKVIKEVKIEKNQVTITEAFNDPEVPNETTQALGELFNIAVKPITLNLDHSFLKDRKMVTETVLKIVNL